MELNNVGETGAVDIQIRRPKRILHFSDGTLEEYSDDEVQDVVDSQSEYSKQVDVKTLPWGPWFYHYAFQSGNMLLAGCDYVGEKLASIFGITSPKFNSEYEEFKRRQLEKENLARDVQQNGGGGLITEDVAASGENPTAVVSHTNGTAVATHTNGLTNNNNNENVIDKEKF